MFLLQLAPTHYIALDSLDIVLLHCAGCHSECQSDVNALVLLLLSFIAQSVTGIVRYEAVLNGVGGHVSYHAETIEHLMELQVLLGQTVKYINFDSFEFFIDRQLRQLAEQHSVLATALQEVTELQLRHYIVCLALSTW